MGRELARESSGEGGEIRIRIDEKLKGVIREKFKTRYGGKTPDEIEKMVKETEQVLDPKYRDLLTVCRAHNGLDVAILDGLLQAVKETRSEFRIRIDEKLKGVIREKFKASYGGKTPDEIEKMVKETEQVLDPKLRDLLTACRLHNGLDVAILHGLLQAVKETRSEGGVFWIDEKLKGVIREKFNASYGGKTPDEIEKMVKETEQVLDPKLRDLLTACRLHNDLDVAILHGLLQAVKEARSEGVKERYMTQLRLAMRWNRVDIARDFILTDKQKDKIGSLDEVMYQGILDDRVEFVKMFLDKGFSLKRFVTYRLMFKLYNSVS